VLVDNEAKIESVIRPMIHIIENSNIYIKGSAAHRKITDDAITNMPDLTVLLMS